MEYVKISKASYDAHLGKSDRLFSSNELKVILNLTRGRYHQWKKEGFLPKGRTEQWGDRTKILYNINELYTVALFKYLVVGIGVTRKKASEISKSIQWDKLDDETDRFLLVSVDKESEGQTSVTPSANFERFHHGEAGFYVDLISVIKHIDGEV